MNAALFVAFLSQRATSPIRIALAALVTLPGIAIAAFSGSLAALAGSAGFLALVFGAGAIGQEVSSGVLQLTFARPVTRSSYVFSRWLAAGTMAVALAWIQLAAGAALVAAHATSGATAGAVAAAAWPLALEHVVQGYALAAVIVGLSALAGGLGDVALYVLGIFGAQILKGYATFRQWAGMERFADELIGTLQGRLSLAWLAGTGPPHLADLVAALSTTALGLALAVIVLNRKELSYASG
ncbi:MAG TPA: hypothetical protein VMH61_08900 [Candidatus Acidoferrales bacterium]|nr:hypothetical protein [Candidatus Acidoferrales bacterium]